MTYHIFVYCIHQLDIPFLFVGILKVIVLMYPARLGYEHYQTDFLNDGVLILQISFL